MALHAFFFGAFVCHAPGMRLMTFLALHPHALDMQLVLPNIRNIYVAVQAITPVGPYCLVRLVTLVTVELHWSVSRHLYLYSLFNCC